LITSDLQSERECREQQFQVEEQKKGCAKMQELIEKLQSKIKVHKKQIEEAVRPFWHWHIN